MFDLNSFVNRQSIQLNNDDLIREATSCLDRFTAAFNACDTMGMDNELHFPHYMHSGSEMLIWNTAGQHPSDFFEQLKKSGWSSTRYIGKNSVLVSEDKVHFVVDYIRCDIQEQIVSHHSNLWIVTKVKNKWGIALRSY